MRKAINWVKRTVLQKSSSGPGACLLRNDPKLRNFEIGEWSYGRPKVLFKSSGAKLKVGKFVSIADDVTIFLGGEHRVDWITTYPFNTASKKWSNIVGHPATKGDVCIGNDVWIGRGVSILSGVCVGDGAVLGAGAVVSKDVEPYMIVVGNPARAIRSRFDEATVGRLKEMKWWDWPADVLNDAVPILQSQDFGALHSFYVNRILQPR